MQPTINQRNMRALRHMETLYLHHLRSVSSQISILYDRHGGAVNKAPCSRLCLRLSRHSSTQNWMESLIHPLKSCCIHQTITQLLCRSIFSTESVDLYDYCLHSRLRRKTEMLSRHRRFKCALTRDTVTDSVTHHAV